MAEKLHWAAGHILVYPSLSMDSKKGAGGPSGPTLKMDRLGCSEYCSGVLHLRIIRPNSGVALPWLAQS